MAGRGGGRRRKKQHEGHHADERWLLTYSDLITLLMALFVIFFAMSSTDAAKYKELKTSLSDAFSGKILDGGSSIMANAAGTGAVESPLDKYRAQEKAAQAHEKRESDNLSALKQRIDSYAKSHGLQAKIDTHVERRGLIVAVLTDKLLFDSGQATLQPAGDALMTSIGDMLRAEATHNILVEGYTDDVPISGSQFPTNWELSTARASTVVRTFVRANVSPERLTAAGRAYLDPVASNATAAGRTRNRRVQIVIPRNAAPSSTSASTTTTSNEPSVDIPDIEVGVKETP